MTLNKNVKKSMYLCLSQMNESIIDSLTQTSKVYRYLFTKIYLKLFQIYCIFYTLFLKKFLRQKLFFKLFVTKL